jgi:hypothetical protein
MNIILFLSNLVQKSQPFSKNKVPLYKVANGSQKRHKIACFVSNASFFASSETTKLTWQQEIG